MLLVACCVKCELIFSLVSHVCLRLCPTTCYVVACVVSPASCCLDVQWKVEAVVTNRALFTIMHFTGGLEQVSEGRPHAVRVYSEVWSRVGSCWFLKSDITLKSRYTFYIYTFKKLHLINIHLKAACVMKPAHFSNLNCNYCIFFITCFIRSGSTLSFTPHKYVKNLIFAVTSPHLASHYDVFYYIKTSYWFKVFVIITASPSETDETQYLHLYLLTAASQWVINSVRRAHSLSMLHVGI